MPPAKIKRVSVEHTRDRVRNNQRRHRARRRDYIATLETKLEEAERTISSLRERVKELEGANGASVTAANMDSTVNGASNSMVAASTSENNDLCGPVAVDLVASHTITSPALVSAPIFKYPTSTFSSGITDYEINMYLVPNLETAVATPTYLMDPITNSPCQESTILCSEAYILIAHQNYKRLSESTIAAFLWPSFRASTSPNEGCRVATSTLYALLGFISDVSSTYQSLS